MSNIVINPELANPKPTVTHAPKGNTPAAATQKGLRTTTNTRAGGNLPAWLTESPTSCPINRGDLSGGTVYAGVPSGWGQGNAVA